MHYYLRMEAVNLDAVLSDTSQLSVIRGSSLLLRQAALDIGKDDKEHNSINLMQIATGASTGLFSFEVPDDKSAELLLEEVTNQLDSKYPDFTFVADILPDSGNFQKDQTTLINKNRYRQLQQLSIALPEKNTTTNSEFVACSLNGTQPASTHEFQKKTISKSVFRRLDHGRKKRNDFYANELDDPSLKNLEFTRDLESLAKSNSYSTLNNKIAVLYFDGNQFGNIQQLFCNNKQARADFDEAIQSRHKSFLRNLLHTIKNDSEFLTNKGEIRLEVLIWGGDEMLLVVPAWQGIRVLQDFFKTMENWKFPKNKKNNHAMTYASGLVFSQAKTPIYRLGKIAKDLAEQVKSTNNETNLFDYLILESLDFPSEPLSKLRDRQYLSKAQGRTFLKAIDPREISPLSELVEIDSLPKSQVISLAQTAIQNPKSFEATETRLLSLLEADKNVQIDVLAQLERSFKAPSSGSVLDMIKRCNNGSLSDSLNIWPWIHLAELWDYIFIENREDNHNA